MRTTVLIVILFAVLGLSLGVWAVGASWDARNRQIDLDQPRDMPDLDRPILVKPPSGPAA